MLGFGCSHTKKQLFCNLFKQPMSPRKQGGSYAHAILQSLQTLAFVLQISDTRRILYRRPLNHISCPCFHI